ncbi:MAG: inositol-3-phosphate synthase, partial [Myxococcota bacterium]
MKQPEKIASPTDKLGVLLPGLGAVATTTIAGVMLARKGLAQPIGSLTQCATIRLGKRTEDKAPWIRDYLPLAKLDQLVFGGWDIFPEDAYASATHANVLEARHLEPIKDELSQVKAMAGAFNPQYVKR